MKFAKRLREDSIAKYEGYYVDYKYLKKQLKSAQEEQSSLTTVLLDSFKGNKKSAFEDTLELELTKLETFLKSKGFQTTNTCIAVLDQAIEVEQLLARNSEEPHTKQLLEKLSKSTDELCKDIAEMASFRELNLLAFMKILKKASKNLASQVFTAQPFIVRLQGELWQTPMEMMVLPVVSEVYSLLRGQSKADRWIPPQSFERFSSSTSFLLTSLPWQYFVHRGR
mmetsp:Transcript_13525/g.28787  ORF Transcript_13525/g.28787 Transcript_13525/m.28787 type:complete len:225 (+) Transcript_13525:234-908(+)